MTLNTFVVNIITMMGLAVGIDYSLFIVSRCREERAAGPDAMESKQGFLVLQKEFGFGQDSPAVITINGDIESPAVRDGLAPVAGG